MYVSPNDRGILDCDCRIAVFDVIFRYHLMFQAGQFMSGNPEPRYVRGA